MVAPDPTWNAMYGDAVQEELEDGICSIIIMCSDTDHHSRFAVDEGVDDDFPSNQSCNVR